MFTIELYKNSAESIIVDKVDYMRKEFEIEGVLREETSLINPVITIEINPTKVIYVRDSENKFVVDNNIVRVITEITKGVLNCNYCYIPLFNRYYYINDIVSVRNNLWSISMTCDVLMSFKDKIYDLDIFCLRQEFEYNELLPDNMMPSNNKKIVSHIEGVDYDNIKDLTNPLTTGYDLVIQTMGKRNNSLLNYSGNSGASNNIYITSPDMGRNAINYLMDFTHNNEEPSIVRLVNPEECIRNIRVYPFNIYERYVEDKVENLDYALTHSIRASFTSVDCGNETLLVDVANCEPIRIRGGNITISQKYNNFLDYEPYTEVLVYIPFVGYISLPTDLVMGKDVYFDYIVDITQSEGLSIVYVKDNNQDIVIQLNKCILAIDLPVDQAGVQDLKKSIFAGFMKLATSVALATVTGGVSLLGAADALATNYKAYAHSDKSPSSHMAFSAKRESIKGNVKADMISSSIGIASSFTIDMLNNQKANVRISDDSGMGLSLWSKYSMIPHAIITRPNPVYYNEDISYSNKYNHLVGRPSSYVGRLGNLHGYTVVGGVHIDNMPNAMNEEKDAIESMLKSGVIL